MLFEQTFLNKTKLPKKLKIDYILSHKAFKKLALSFADFS